MKKRLISCIVALLGSALIQVYGVDRATDLVVLLDTSSSMFDSRPSLASYTVGPFLSDFLRSGDTFHLISFASTPKLEMARRVVERGDLETLISRLLLLYPLDTHTDIIAALDYAVSYSESLPQGRPKTVVFISDGIHSPSESSPYFGLSDAEVSSRLEQTSGRIKAKGWDFQYLHVPLQGRRPLTSTREVPSQVLSLTGTEPASSPASSAPAATTNAKALDSNKVQATTAIQPPSPSPSAAPSSSQKTTAGAKNQVGDSPTKVDSSTSTTIPRPTDPIGQTTTTSTTLREVSGVDVTPMLSERAVTTTTIVVPGASTTSTTTTIPATPVELLARFPAKVQGASRSLSIPISVRNPSAVAVRLVTSSIRIDGVEMMGKATSIEVPSGEELVLPLRLSLPSTWEEGAKSVLVEPRFDSNITLVPAAAQLDISLTLFTATDLWAILAPFIPLALVLLAVLLAGAITFMVLRRAREAPKRAVRAAATSKRKPQKKEQPSTQGVLSGGDSKRRLGAEIRKIPSAGEEAASPITGHAASSLKNESTRIEGLPKADLGTGQRVNHPENLGERPQSRVDDTQQLFASFAAQKAARDTVAVAVRKPEKEIKSKEPGAIDTSAIPYSVKAAHERVMLSLYVSDQNPAIGRRNVHLLKAGGVLTVGGGRRDDFYIFLIKMPKRLAEIRYDGVSCTFIPRRADLFETGPTIIENCVGVPIKLVSEKGYPLELRLDQFEDPLRQLNRFLHSIDSPGLKVKPDTLA